MSLYAQLPDLLPLPTVENYAEVHEATNERFGKGGSWEDVTSWTAALNKDRELKTYFMELAKYGGVLQDDELTSEPCEYTTPHFLVGKAFAQGFFQQLTPSQFVYSSKLSIVKGLGILSASYATQNFSEHRVENDEEATRENIKRFESAWLFRLGAYGLNLVGDISSDYIDKWAREAYPADTRLVRAFSLGHGAMISCARMYQNGLNDQLIGIASREVNLDEEVLTVLADRSEDS